MNSNMRQIKLIDAFVSRNNYGNTYEIDDYCKNGQSVELIWFPRLCVISTSLFTRID